MLPIDGLSSDFACSMQYVAYHMITALLVACNATFMRLDQIWH